MATQLKLISLRFFFWKNTHKKLIALMLSKNSIRSKEGMHLFILKQMQFPSNMSVVVLSVFKFGCLCNCIYTPNTHVFERWESWNTDF